MSELIIGSKTIGEGVNDIILNMETRTNNPFISSTRKEFSLTLRIAYPMEKKNAISKVFTYGGLEELNRYLDICLNGAIDDKIGTTGLDYTYHERLIASGRFQKIIDILKKDKESTRAICTLRNEDNESENDPPCFTNIQLRIIDGKLQTYVFFRSWDIQRAAMFNLIFITKLMEMAAKELDVEVGRLIVRANSAHYYLSEQPIIDAYIKQTTLYPEEHFLCDWDDFFI